MEESSKLWSFFEEEEIEIASIILDLPNLISQLESLNRCSFAWGCKRKRSDSKSAVPRPSLCGNRSSPPPPPPQQPSETERKVKFTVKVKAEATSPSTPLAFSPSESDDKSSQSLKRDSKKRLHTKEELLETIDGLTERRDSLRREVEIVKRYHDEQKALNLALKAKKEEVTSCLRSEIPRLEMARTMNPGIQLDQNYQISMFHQQQLISACESQLQGRFQDYPYGQGGYGFFPPGLVNQIGPPGIPDLNVRAEETFAVDPSQPLDVNRVLVADNRFMAAEARKRRMATNQNKKRRMVKVKETKSSFAATKPNHSIAIDNKQ